MQEIYTVYILSSKKYGKIYTGYTSNLIQRFYSHNEKSNKGWTRSFRPWTVVYAEWFSDKSEAIAREKWFKSGIGRTFIKHNIAVWSSW